MRILPFRKPTPPQTALSMQQDWSQQEMADFYRAYHLLSQNGVAIGMDRGQTEVGDPWMVFYDTATQDVFLHVARFDDQCMLICESLDLKLTRPVMTDLILAFEDAVRELVSVRQDRHSNVLLHPAARIIMSISAVFLLFKLENGGTAQAKALLDPAAADATRKQDVGTTARVHQALARIFDITDAPAAAAALAGAILSSELARAHLAADHQASGLVSTNDDHSADGVVALDTHRDMTSVVISSDEAASVERSKSASPALAVEHGSVDLSPKVQIAMHTTVAPLPAEQPPAQQTTRSMPEPPAPQPQTESEHHPVASTNAPIAAPSPATGDESGSIVSTAASPAQDALIPTSLAARAVQTLLADTVLPGADPVDATDTPDQTSASLGDITIADLQKLDATVALFRETTLTGTILTDTIIDFMARFGSYDVEFAEGRVLIEQHDAAALSSDLIGIWTNIMEDGSAISVVGHIDLVTDVTTSLT